MNRIDHRVYLLFSFLAATLYLSNTALAQGSSLFFDAFESGTANAGGWTINARRSNYVEFNSYAKYLGNYGARVKRDANIERAVSTVGYSDIQIHYQRRTANYDSSEYFYVEWWDGGMVAIGTS